MSAKSAGVAADIFSPPENVSGSYIMKEPALASAMPSPMPKRMATNNSLTESPAPSAANWGAGLTTTVSKVTALSTL